VRHTERKEERILLMTTDAKVTREQFLRYARGKGAPELIVPAEVLLVEKIPLLGSGKPDFVAALAMAKEKAAVVPSVASKPAAEHTALHRPRGRPTPPNP